MISPKLVIPSFLLSSLVSYGQFAVQGSRVVPMELNLPEGIQIVNGQPVIPGAGQAVPGRPSPQARTPEQQRTQLLQKLTIDRTTSGILAARLAEQNEANQEIEKKAEDDKAAEQKKPANEPKVELLPIPTGNASPEAKAAVAQENARRLAEAKAGKTDTPQDPKAAEAAAKQAENQKKIAQVQKDVSAFGRNVVLGNWDKVRSYLEEIPDNDANIAFNRIVSQLAVPAQVRPRAELAQLGAKPHREEQYLRPEEIIALSDSAKKAPAKQVLQQLANLIKGDRRPPRAFFKTLKKGTRYFGMEPAEARIRTAELLINAGHLADAAPFLPDDAAAREAKEFPALNLLGRYHAESHGSDRGKEHLPKAWELSLFTISEKKAPLPLRVEALYRALSLLPDLEGDTGQEWFTKTFSSASTEAYEILAAVGTLTAQTRNHPSPQYRMEQLNLQSIAANTLTKNEEIDLKPWQEILTLYTRNWNEEAKRSYQYDTSTSMRPQAQVDPFGNLFYSPFAPPRMQPQQTNSRRVSPIPSGELLRSRPQDRWLENIDSAVHLSNLKEAARLLLKVKEEELAFPLLKQLAPSQPDLTKGLVREMINVWAENNNPNQQSRYRSSYSYFYGYNQRAETIPLTRSKQERNLRKLAEMVRRVQELGLDDNFQEEFSTAFIQAHSQAEVWRVEALAAVFGDLSELDSSTIASLLRRMRQNLAGLWPNPKVQEQAKTKRKDVEMQEQVKKGYKAAQELCFDGIGKYPDNWELEVQIAALKYEESNYIASIDSLPEHSLNKREALDGLATAADLYMKTLPLEDSKNESVEPFTTWYYGALGSTNLGALKAEHQPVPSEFEKIKAALESIPGEVGKRHRDEFAKTLNARLANVSADLKYRFLESALQITGQHERIEEAARVFEYYQDLVTEIELDAHLDGSDQIDPEQPFGLFVNLRHTREIERESGGFSRYLVNQNNQPYAYNYGRPTEDYRDKFEKSARTALEEHFEIVSVTFHNSKVQSRTDSQRGWTVTPYAYFLLKAKGPEIDTIPPLKIDLDFLDTSGYVVLPITSAAIPISASEDAPSRPTRDLSLSMILDEREAEEKGIISLEIKATGHGLIPTLDELIELPPPGFKVASTEDRDLQVEELDAQTDDGAPRSSHEWKLTLEPKKDNLPEKFTFPEVIAELSTKEDEGLLLQKYDDVDLVTVDQSTKILAGDDSGNGLLWLIPVLAILGVVGWLLLRPKPEEETDAGPVLPSSLTPVTVLHFLEDLHQNSGIEESERSELAENIKNLRDKAFGPNAKPPEDSELENLASKWAHSAHRPAA